MTEEARRLHAAGAVRGRSWSLAQVCEHLALAVQGTVDAPKSLGHAATPPEWWVKLSGLQRTKRRIMRTGLLMSGRFPEGVPAPEFVAPSAAAEFERSLKMLEAAVEAFHRKLRESDAPWPFHPLLGPMTGWRWRRFHELHARHHFKYFAAAG